MVTVLQEFRMGKLASAVATSTGRNPKQLKKLSLQRKDRASDRPNPAPDDVVFGLGHKKQWWEAAPKDATIKAFRWHDLRHTIC